MGVPSVPSRTPEAFTFMDENCRSLLQSQLSTSLSNATKTRFSRGGDGNDDDGNDDDISGGEGNRTSIGIFQSFGFLSYLSTRRTGNYEH